MIKKLRKYKLILINENGLDAKEVNSKSIFLFSLLLFSSLLFIIMISFFSTDIEKLISLKSLKKYKSDNKKLESIISNQQSQIQDLNEQIQQISERDESLRRLVKLPPIDSDTRKLGVGGSSNNGVLNDVHYLLPSDDINLDKLQKNIDFLQRSLNLENMSYTEIEKMTDSNLDEILHHPAIYPVILENCKFSSRFGYRIDPFTKKRKLHEGHDFSAKVGEEVLCTANGIVKSSRWYGSFGNYIEIDHGNGYVTVFGHLSKRLVKKGEKVERGQIIGKIGNTGKSTAPHLHYEIIHNKKRIDPTNFYYDVSHSD